jgi:hypothetical protein
MIAFRPHKQTQTRGDRVGHRFRHQSLIYVLSHELRLQRQPFVGNPQAVGVLTQFLSFFARALRALTKA